mgnify:CR=1 FL=1
MKRIIKILTIVSLAFVLKFYLFDLPRCTYALKEYYYVQKDLDSLQNERILQLVKNNNALVEYLKGNNKTTAK